MAAKTRRNAHAVCKIATLAKLISGNILGAQTIDEYQEHEILRDAAVFLETAPLRFSPRLHLSTVANETVDLETLPASAKRIRKD